METTLPLFHVAFFFLLKCLFHFFIFFAAACALFDDLLSEDEADAYLKVGLPHFEGGGKVGEGGFVEVGEALEGGSGMRRGERTEEGADCGWDIMEGLFFAQGGEGVASGADRGPPGVERGGVSKEVLFAVQVGC
jgi:hypothetical protein